MPQRLRAVLPGLAGSTAVLFSGLFPRASLNAQSPAITDLPSRPACSSCAIVVTPVLAIGDVDGPGALAGAVYDGVKDSKGNYHLLAGERAPPLSFDARGRFLRQLGRLGPGPGEFTSPVNIELIGGDTIAVFDRRRVHLFDGNGTSLRSVTVPAAATARSVRVGGGAVIAGTVQTRDAVGLPFHFLSAAFDSVTRSFGAETGADPTGVPRNTGIVLTTVRDRGFWSARAREYLLVRWDSGGRPQQVLQRRPEWWQGQVEPAKGDIATVPPPSVIRALQETSDGLLWLVAAVPGPRWREGFGPRRPDGAYDVAKMRIDLLNDTILELIDPRTMQVVASSRTQGAAIGFVGPGELLFIAEEESGVPKGVVKKVEFRRAQRP
jgi:hypothetical protein